MNTIIRISVIAATCFAISACGGNKKPVTDADIANSPDITRPPVIVKNQKVAEVEKNPEETISFEEWKRQREADEAAVP